MSLEVLVAGATGRFGEVTALLLERGHRVRALTREPEAAAAGTLEERGAEIVRGDYDDPTSLASAARGVDAVFASGTAHRAGPQGELRHGVNLVEALAAAGAPYLVYVSGAGADRETGVPVLESKRQVEERIRAANLRHTILAPVYLMENLLNPWNLRALRHGSLALALPPARRLQQVATADVAAFAVLTLERAHELEGERIELAGDELTGPEAATALARASARDVDYEELDPSDLRSVSEGLVRLFEWLDSVGTSADIRELHRAFPEVGWQSFARWAYVRDWSGLGEPCYSSTASITS
jgi:uncharacterized protein YbjT (DUF2867 family)